MRPRTRRGRTIRTDHVPVVGYDGGFRNGLPGGRLNDAPENGRPAVNGDRVWNLILLDRRLQDRIRVSFDYHLDPAKVVGKLCAG